MSRDINKGYEFNIRRDMCPIASEKNGRIEDIIAENVGVDKEEILVLICRFTIVCAVLF